VSDKEALEFWEKFKDRSVEAKVACLAALGARFIERLENE